MATTVINIKVETEARQVLAKLLEAGHWFLLGVRANRLGLDDQVFEAAERLNVLGMEIDGRRVEVRGACQDGACSCDHKDGALALSAGFPPYHEGCTCWVVDP